MTTIKELKNSLKSTLANDISEGIVAIRKVIATNSIKYNVLIHQQHRFNENTTSIHQGTISNDDAKRTTSQIFQALLFLVDNLVESDITVKPILNGDKEINPSFAVASELDLEKIIGKSSLTKIEWFAKMVEASRSVCRIVVSKPNQNWKGTGFLVAGHFIFTNYHVIESKEDAEHAIVEFNFVNDKSKIATYKLDSNTWVGNKELDFVKIKVKDDPTNLLSQWGFLEVDTKSEILVGGAAPIIQHPDGQVQQVSIEGNFIKRISPDRTFIFYTTDTLRGSSGSPVFNNNWQVIALHHASVTDADENRGILFNRILTYLRELPEEISGTGQSVENLTSTTVPQKTIEVDPSTKDHAGKESPDLTVAGKTFHQSADKIYNIEKIDKADFS